MAVSERRAKREREERDLRKNARVGESVHAFLAPSSSHYSPPIRAETQAPQLPTEHLSQASKTSACSCVQHQSDHRH